MPVVSFLGAVSAEGFGDRTRAYREGLREAGYAEGVTVLIDYRWAENQLDRHPALAAGRSGRKKVAIITAHGGTAPAIAAKAATTTIPVVFTTPEDPVAAGLVPSLSHPGGNLTGINLFIGELMSKRLELLGAMLPQDGAYRGVRESSESGARAEAQVKEAESAVAGMGVQVRVFQAGTIQQINAAFATFATDPPDALFVSPDPYYRRAQLVTLAARHAIPASFSVCDFVEAGGLMSYGTNIVDSYRQAGVYTGPF